VAVATLCGHRGWRGRRLAAAGGDIDRSGRLHGIERRARRQGIALCAVEHIDKGGQKLIKLMRKWRVLWRCDVAVAVLSVGVQREAGTVVEGAFEGVQRRRALRFGHARSARRSTQG
jgi:hypothetical protein